MMKPESVRSPRGAKPVMKAFFEKLDTIATDQQVAVAKAAFSMVRDEMKARAEKLKVAKAKTKAKAAKTVAEKPAVAAKPAPKAKAKPRVANKAAKKASPRRAPAAVREPAAA
jgi:sec-independent protein translocase protein TatB